MKTTPDSRLCGRNVRWSLLVDLIVVVNLSELYR